MEEKGRLNKGREGRKRERGKEEGERRQVKEKIFFLRNKNFIVKWFHTEITTTNKTYFTREFKHTYKSNDFSRR